MTTLKEIKVSSVVPQTSKRDRCKCLVSHPRAKGNEHPLDRRLGEPQNRSGRYGKEKIVLPCREKKTEAHVLQPNRSIPARQLSHFLSTMTTQLLARKPQFPLHILVLVHSLSVLRTGSFCCRSSWKPSDSQFCSCDTKLLSNCWLATTFVYEVQNNFIVLNVWLPPLLTYWTYRNITFFCLPLCIGSWEGLTQYGHRHKSRYLSVTGLFGKTKILFLP
jgi:hypothetical protein